MPDVFVEKQGTGKWPWWHLRDTNVDSDSYRVLACRRRAVFLQRRGARAASMLRSFFSVFVELALVVPAYALPPQLESSGTYFVIPRNLYPPIEQGAVIVNRTRRRADARRLLDFLFSVLVQAQLAKSGLAPVH